MTFRSALLAVAAMLGFIINAGADPLPPPSLTGYFCAGVFQYCSSNALVYPQNTSASYTSDPNSTPGSASATGGGMLSPLPSLFASAAASGNGSGYSFFSLTYSIELTGPSGSVPITINTAGLAGLNSEVSTSIFNPANSTFSYLAFVQNGSVSVNANRVDLVPFEPGSSYNRSDTVNLVEGVIYRVGLIAIADAVSGFSEQSASVDPYFSDIPVGYDLLTSPGIGNSPVSSVPVPATLPLFAAGISALGLLEWRRRRKAAGALAA